MFLKELMLIKQGHHDLLMKSMNLSDIAILNIKGSDYRCITNLISKNEAINLMQNADLTEKSGILSNIKDLLSHVKVCKEILTFGDIEIEKINFTAIRLLLF